MAVLTATNIFAGVQAKKKAVRRAGRMAAFLGASSAGLVQGYSATRDHEQLQVRWSTTQDELGTLLEDPSKMSDRFGEFLDKKYGEQGLKAFQDTELSTKYLAFQYNVQLAHERNKRSEGRVVHGITSLMDLTRGQFRKLFGFKGEPDAVKKVKASASQDPRAALSKVTCEGFNSCSESPLASRDWRDDGAVTPVKDQGQCGSCWAFSTVESMESAALVQGLVDQDDPFIGAPQELVSCDNAGSDEGCNGGLPENAFKYLQDTPLEPEADYPYRSGDTKQDGSCKLEESEGVLEVTGTTQTGIMGVGETDEMKDYILNKGPMSIGVAANDEWQTYVGGVLSFDECPDDQPNHAVQVVALNTDDADEPYWVVRNSWATGWGEDGFIRLSYGENTCNIAFMAMGVEVTKVDTKKASTSQKRFRRVIEDKKEVSSV